MPPEFNESSCVEQDSERNIRDELMDILSCENPLDGLDRLMDTGLIKEIIPELLETNTEKGDQDPVWHPEGNTWVHTRMVVDILAQQRQPVEVVLAGLLHDVAKPRTQVRKENGRISNLGHDEVGAEMAEVICRRLNLRDEQIELITNMVRNHMRMHLGRQMGRSKLIKLLSTPNIQEMVALQHADSMGTTGEHRHEKSLLTFYTQELEELKESLTLVSPTDAEPLVTGAILISLGHNPGPVFKAMLEQAMDAQRAGEFSNSEEATEWARRTFS